MPSFASTTSPTPFSVYDSESDFQTDADDMVTFVKRRLGDDILSVELTRKQIYAALEESSLEYSRAVNEMRITSDLVNVLGLPTGSTSLTNKYPRQTLEYLVRQAEPYATEALVGGVEDYELGYIDLVSGQQDYNIYADIKHAVSGTNLWSTVPASRRTRARIVDIFHFEPLAAQHWLLNASNITNFLATNMNYESYVNSTVFYVLPVFEDVLRRGMLETAYRIRRSNTSYELMGSKLRIYPIPTTEQQLGKLFFRIFLKQQDPTDPSSVGYGISGGDDASIYGISGPSNVPLGNIPYNTITSPGRHWIRMFTLAICRETLGLVRSKFKTVPIPNAELQLNGEELVTQGREDQEKLKEQLKEWLGNLTNEKLNERLATQAEWINKALRLVAMPSGLAISVG